MFREILTRLAESASDTNEDMQVCSITECLMFGIILYYSFTKQSYVLEIVLTLECALDHLPEPVFVPTTETTADNTSRKISALSPLPS